MKVYFTFDGEPGSDGNHRDAPEIVPEHIHSNVFTTHVCMRAFIEKRKHLKEYETLSGLLQTNPSIESMSKIPDKSNMLIALAIINNIKE